MSGTHSSHAGAPDWASLPAPCVLEVFCLAESSADAISWKCACRAFYAVCGKIDVLR